MKVYHILPLQFSDITNLIYHPAATPLLLLEDFIPHHIIFPIE